jgi:2-polyprenyl-6-methoxyphenol hydroxylase-like FAD-dependent oxidoreductase
MTTPKLPVVIAGAGPCGLVAAITLQKEGVRFVIVEGTARERLCSNVGSGFDLAPTAIDILKNRLEIPDMDKGFDSYGGMYMCNMEGKPLRKCTMTAISKDYVALSVNRAAMQECFLKFLLANEQEKTEDFDEMSILKCGVEVTGYEEHDETESVMVELSDGSNIVGSVLLGCDGIHLAVHRSMMTSLPAPVKDDPLHFCNTVCWWGKTELRADTEFFKALEATQEHLEEGSLFVWALGDGKHPGTFMCAPCGDTLMLEFLVESLEEPHKKRTQFDSAWRCLQYVPS